MVFVPAVWVGRRAELSRIAGAFSSARAVGLVGVAGIGKTSLARVFAARRRAVWVSCAAGWSADALASHLERALHLPPDLGFSSSPAERGARIAGALDRGRRLLVLDDLHLVAGAEAILSPLLRALDRGSVLWTSRRRLRLDARAQAEAFVLELGPLDRRSATALARRVLVARGASPSGASRLAAAARGHPLAVKLGATTTGAVPALLAAMLEGLRPADRAALLEIAAHRIAWTGPIPRGLEEGLFVSRTPSGVVAHDLVRETVGALPPEIHRRAARRYAAKSARDPLAARERVHHLVLAGDFSSAAAALESTALRLWNVRDLGELRRLIDATAEGGARLGPAARVADALLLSRAGRHDDADRVLDSLGPVRRLPRAARIPYFVAVARVAYGRGDRRALEAAARAIARIPPGKDPRDWLRPLHLFVFGLVFEGRAAEASGWVDRFERRLGRSHPLLEWMRGDVALVRGEAQSAIACYERAITTAEGGLPRFDLAFLRSNVADARLDLGDPAAALAQIDLAIASVAPLDLPDAEAALQIFRARALAALGRRRPAMRLLDFAVRELDGRPLQRVAFIEALLERGRLRAGAGALATARRDLESALDVASRTAARLLVAKARIRLAEVETRAGRTGRAARLLDEASGDAVLAPVEAALDLARGRLGLARGTLDDAERSVRRAQARVPGVPVLVAEGEALLAAILRARGATPAGGGLVLDVSRREVVALGRTVDLSSTPLLFRLVEALARAGGPMAKEAVFAAVWRRRYRADLHDKNVYETVRRVRRRLGLADRVAPGKVALVSTREGYALVGPVTIAGDATPGADVAPSARDARRERILALAAGGPITNADVRRAQGVFRTTATEDLRELVAEGRLRRVGAGRGARYEGA